MTNNFIEALVPIQCPHCDKEVVVKLRLTPPDVEGVYKPEAVQEVIETLEHEHASIEEPEA